MTGDSSAPQEPPDKVEGPAAFGGSVVQSGNYVAGHNLTIDQSVHNVGPIAAWLNRRRATPTLYELSRARRDLLDEVKRSCTQELDRSLYSVARIDLGLKRVSSAVESPLRAVLRLQGATDRPIDRGTPILNVYRDVGKQLLILGEPGGGNAT